MARRSRSLIGPHRIKHPVGDALVPGGATIPDLDGAVGHRPDQVAVVGDEHDGSRVGLQGVLQHVTTGKVEVVGGLVQDQEVDRYGQRLGQRQAGLFATRQVTHTAVYGVAPEPKGS